MIIEGKAACFRQKKILLVNRCFSDRYCVRNLPCSDNSVWNDVQKRLTRTL